MAIWEDKDSLQQAFPRATAWGQAVDKDGGIVSSTSPEGASTTEETEVIREDGPTGPKPRPARVRRVPARLADPAWVR